jgi:tetratricopeptide (TPR) repeat protein
MTNPLLQKLHTYETFVEHDPENALLRIELGDLYMQAGRCEDALSSYDACPAASEYSAKARSRCASALLALGRPAEAERRLRELMEDVGPDPVLVHNLGVALAKQQQWAAACGQFASAAAAGFRHPSNQVQWIHALQQQGSLQAALEVGARWAAEMPGPQSQGVLALLHMDMESFDEAARLGQAVLAVAPDDPNAGVVVATTRLLQADAESARRLLEPVVARDPANGRAWMALGLALLVGGESANAVEALRRCTAILSTNPGAAVALAWASLVAHGPQAAERDFLHAVEVNRSFGESYGGLAVAQALQGRLDEARHNMRLARRLSPDAAYGAQYAQAIIAATEGQHEQSARLIADILQTTIREGLPSLSQVLMTARRFEAAPTGATLH